MCRISIVVAAYNVEHELPLLLESICSSSFSDVEVCICDDASSDGTRRVAEGFADRLSLRVTTNPTNRGVTYARNQAFALATAPLVLFVDADVRLRRDTIASLVRALEASGADVVEGIYSDTALDPGFFSNYYASFANHSFIAAGVVSEYNVFNAWCALCRRQVIEAVGGHTIVPKGVEVENESLGRAIVARGYTIRLEPEIAVDHHWGGLRKLGFIFTKRVYWWVKVYFASGRRFEAALTTPGYALGSAGALTAGLCSTLAPWSPWLWVPVGVGVAAFLASYLSFFVFVGKRKGARFLAASVVLSAAFAVLAGASGIYSAIEEVVLLLLRRRTSLDPRSLQG